MAGWSDGQKTGWPEVRMTGRPYGQRSYGQNSRWHIKQILKKWCSQFCTGYTPDVLPANDRWYRLAKSFAFWKFGTQNQRHIGGGAGYIHSSTMLFMKLPQSYNLSDSTTMKHVFLSSKDLRLLPPFFWFSWVFKSISRIFFSSSWEHQSSLKYYVYIKVQWFFFLLKKSQVLADDG